MLDAIRTGDPNVSIPVFGDENEDRLRRDINGDVAFLGAVLGERLTRIRFRPAFGADFDFIRMAVSSAKKRPRVVLAPEPAPPLQPPGIWLVAEAVVELHDMEMPVATWYAVETEDGFCGLASSALSHDEELQPEDMQEVRDSLLGVLESESRRLVSDGRIRTISQYLRKLPAGPAGKPILSIIVLKGPVRHDTSEQ